jgi:ribosome-associated toxin RatA of RatAB toxin-antitoxin module
VARTPYDVPPERRGARVTEAVQDSIVVQADVDTVWDVIADFASYPEWQPDMKEAEVLETDEHGWGTKARFVVDAKFMHATLVLAYTYTDDTMSWVLVDGEGVRKNDGTYTVEAQPDGTTRVTYELEVVPAVPVPGFMRRQAARRIVEAALRDMKHRAEGAR